MAGDMLAAGLLALTTTRLWARRVRRGGAPRQLEAVLLRPPYNLVLFFFGFAATFWMLAQPTFALSVVGQVAMGTVYVFNKQAVQECYVVLSHDHLGLFRELEFIGSCAFNLCMAASTLGAVLLYDHAGRTAPFYAVAFFSAGWALVVGAYFGVRLRAHRSVPWAVAERELLAARLVGRAGATAAADSGLGWWAAGAKHSVRVSSGPSDTSTGSASRGGAHAAPCQ